MNKRWLAVLLCITALLLCACERRQTGSGPQMSPEAVEEFYARKAAAATAVSEENVLMSDSGDTVFGSDLLRTEVSSITFLGSLEGKPGNSWDVSQGQNGTVWAWTVSGGGFYELYIAAERGIYAPENCSGLFAGYTNLTGIDFGDVFDTCNAVNMSEMFLDCGSYAGELDLSGFSTGNVTDMSRMFARTYLLTGVDLSSFDTSAVTNMGGMFAGSGVSELDLSGFDTSVVTDMSSMFDGCALLTQLDLSSFDTAAVTDMSGMFSACNALEKLNLSSFDTSSVRTMAYMFDRCGLPQIDVSSFDTSRVESMESMFACCWNVTELDLSNLNTSRVETMAAMFYDCSSLRFVDVSSFDTSSVTDMSNMFYHDHELETPDVGGFDVSNVKFFDGFMLPDVEVDGKPWEELFTARHTLQD